VLGRQPRWCRSGIRLGPRFFFRAIHSTLTKLLAYRHLCYIGARPWYLKPYWVLLVWLLLALALMKIHLRRYQPHRRRPLKHHRWPKPFSGSGFNIVILRFWCLR